MDNIITGVIAVAMFLAFTGGLAESIGAIPFILIVVIVGAMLCTDFYESTKESLQRGKEKKSNS